MRTLRLSVTGVVAFALLGGLSGVVGAQDESEPVAFPTGLFVSVENDEAMLEFNEDGTGVSHNLELSFHTPFTFAVDGNVYTWLTAEFSGSDQIGQPTYSWDYDGERLVFELLGEDVFQYRKWLYAENTFELVEDPVEVVVAMHDIPAGGIVYSTWAVLRIVPAERVGPDVFTDHMDVIGNIAAVDIAKGQPITPDMLEPPIE